VLRDGQTAVIAGLIGESQTVRDEGLPFLKDLPVVGALFRRQATTRQRSELAIFVTPYLVRTDAEADAVRDRIRKRLEDGAPGALDGTALTRRPPSR
jgi:general secretion pathway protein D